MDDFLSKPIRSDALASALAPLRPTAAPALDAAILQQLRETLGESTTAEIVETFLGEGPELVATMRRSVEQVDADALRRAAHTLKSNAATFGGAALAALCDELERIGEAGAVDGAADLVARAEAEYERVRTELQAELR
jgi:HPt (histidine-containing phosphotransfer) domain-containing protein